MSRSKEQWLAETGGFPAIKLLTDYAKPVARPSIHLPKDAKLAFYDSETTGSNITGSRHFWSKEAVPDVVCVFYEWTGKYRYYSQETLHQMPKDLKDADGLVSYNGDSFDHGLIARHLRVSKKKLGFPRSLDLCSMLRDATSHLHSLNNLAIVNLGTPKAEFGDAVSGLPLKAKKAACKSDVDQLRELFHLYLRGKLKVPGVRLSRKNYRQMPFGGRCPNCKLVATVNDLPVDEEQLTEGQLYDQGGENGSDWFFCCGCAHYLLRQGDLLFIGLSQAEVVVQAAKRDQAEFRARVRKR